MKWSNLRTLGKSKIVQSSYIWLFIVPFSAKILSHVDSVLNFDILGSHISLSMTLPFSWQMLFGAACFFSIANIIYSTFCPEIIGRYLDFSEFNQSGKTLAQIHGAFKKIAWDNKLGIVKSDYSNAVAYYYKHFCNQTKLLTEEEINENGALLFNDVSQENKGKTVNNAFYYVQNQCDNYNKLIILICGIMYFIGLFFVALIAMQNIFYVINTMSNS